VCPPFYHFIFADNGRGFDPKKRDKIFDPFQQQKNNYQNGIGLGLATCKKIIELHEGQIWAETEPGKGCSMHFTLKQAASVDYDDSPTE